MAENTATYCRLSFYNMLAHIVYKNRMVEENVAVKNVWEKDNTVFLDLYFYRAKKSQVIDGAFIHDMYDLTSERYYKTAADFIDDFFSERQLEQQRQESKTESISIDLRHLEDIKDELVILIFIAKCNNNFTEIKVKTLKSFINKLKPLSATLSEQYISTYLKSLTPSEDDFYQALDNLKIKSPEEASAVAVEAVRISASDGAIHYNERIYLAEILQTLREHGLEPDVGL